MCCLKNCDDDVCHGLQGAGSQIEYVETNAEESQFGKRGTLVQSRFARVLCTVLSKWNPATKKEITDKVNGWFSSYMLGF